ncbi:MAG TPA: IS630 family transposase [Bryobacteraceae bacterium]|nr:IS630 family transposase [Bryobacteraceae bacterium]
MAHTRGMGRPPLSFDIAPKHQRELAELLSGGVQQVRVVLRALALLQLARGASAPQIANVVPLTAEAIRSIGRRYQQGGLERTLYEKPRPGAAEVLDDSQKQRLIAMVCSNPPEGRARWTVRLVAEEAVKRKLVPRVGRETVRILLLSHDLKPWREKMWVVADLDEEYITKMEDVLEVYERPYDQQEPVVCLDEKPITLHADVRTASPAVPGREARRDNEYERRGTANVFCAVEPKAGRHFTFSTPDRSGFEFARVTVELALAYPEARTIHLVMDNLNIHRQKALAHVFGAEMTAQVWDRFTVHYTPNRGS